MLRLLRSCWRASAKFRFGVVLLAILVFVALIAPLIYRPIIGDVSPARPGTFAYWLPCSPQHPLGTDGHGRDLLTDYLAGLRTSLQIGFIAGLIATLVGIFFGFVAGYQGRWQDTALTTFANMFLVVPAFPILVGLTLVLRKIDVFTMSLVLALFSWPLTARVIRAQVLSMKQQPYVDLARVSGQGDWAIIFTELLPNLLPYLLTSFTFSVVGAMAAEVGLEAVGLGPSNIVTLGMMINFANNWAVYTRGRMEILLIPVALVVLVFMAIMMINRGMEEYTNPRLQNVTGK